jgi:hypothetical protein
MYKFCPVVTFVGEFLPIQPLFSKWWISVFMHHDDLKQVAGMQLRDY